MVQETRRIIEHIETEREQLGENLEEIESRIKDAADPRAWYDRNPGLILGAAAAGGLVIGLLCTSRSSASADSAEMVDPTGFSEPRPRPERHLSESRHVKTIKNTLDTTIAALVGLGARKFQDFVADNLPGFQEQYNVANQRQAAWDAADSKPATTY
jgi:hypothetical protein